MTKTVPSYFLYEPCQSNIRLWFLSVRKSPLFQVEKEKEAQTHTAIRAEQKAREQSELIFDQQRHATRLSKEVSTGEKWESGNRQTDKHAGRETEKDWDRYRYREGNREWMSEWVRREGREREWEADREIKRLR